MSDEFARSLQIDYKKYRDLYKEQAEETQRLSNVLKNRDYEVHKLNRVK